MKKLYSQKFTYIFFTSYSKKTLIEKIKIIYIDFIQLTCLSNHYILKLYFEYTLFFITINGDLFEII